MNWEKMKNLTLVFFVLLNLLLAYMNHIEMNHYLVTEEQSNAIYHIFNQNRISMYCKMIRQYPPMRALTVAGYAYDATQLIERLFPADVPVAHTASLNKDVFVWENIRLTISNGYITYDNPAGLRVMSQADKTVSLFNDTSTTNTIHTAGDTSLNERLSKSAATEISGAFIQQYYPDYRLDDALLTEDGWRLYYRQLYQKHIIHTNFIALLVTENGIEQLDMQYGTPIGYTGTLNDLYAPDEVLLTFVQRIKTIAGDTPVIIRNMDIVYYQEEYSTQENIPLKATPYYRIFIEHQETPFMINAYTNQML